MTLRPTDEALEREIDELVIIADTLRQMASDHDPVRNVLARLTRLIKAMRKGERLEA